MKITIDKSLANLKKLQGDYQQFHDDVWQDPESYGIIAESLKVAIDTMHKYQKIAEIVDKWNEGIYDDEGLSHTEVMELVSDEVYDDGNDD